MSAADLTERDATEVGLFTLFTIAAFWLAHTYSYVLGKWSAEGVTPTFESTKAALVKDLPMLGAPMLPIALLVIGSFLTTANEALINVASGLCVLELGATAFFSARRGGGSAALALGAAALAGLFGASIIVLKLLLHA